MTKTNTDIVERLRTSAIHNEIYNPIASCAMRDGANEIERLREKLREQSEFVEYAIPHPNLDTQTDKTHNEKS